jgi:hypothetical protein
MNATELRALQNPLIVLLLVVGIGAGLIYQLDRTLASTKREFAQQQNQLREARTRLQKSGDEKDLIVRHLPSYQYLQRIGFVGDEQRLNWLEGLRLSNQQSQLFGVQYQIGSQQPYAFADELDAGQLALHQSVMKLDFQLLHEGDLMRFFATLGKQGAGFFAVNQCKIERVSTGGSIRFQPNLRAACDLSWITLRPSSPGDKKS